MWSRLSLTTPAVRWCCVVWPSKRLVGVNGAKPWRSRFATWMQLVEFTGDEVISAVFPQYENRKIKPEETQRLQHKDMFTFNKDVVCRKKCIASLWLGDWVEPNPSHQLYHRCSDMLDWFDALQWMWMHTFSLLSLVYALKESVCWSRFSR